MDKRDFLLDELKRLNRRNDLLEKQVNQGNTNLAIEETIKNNALTMCEIVKALR